MTPMRRAAALAAALVTLGTLGGCTSNPVAAPPASPLPTAAASTPAPTPTTPPPTQVAADATPVSVKCRTLAPTAVVRALEPELRTVKGWTPDAGTPSARLSELNGATCAWTSAAGDVLEVSVAKPSATDSTALKNDLVERSQSVPTYGGEAYFQVVDSVGQVDVFRGRTWLFVRSNRFFEPGDAVEIVGRALEALGYPPNATPTPTTSAGAPVTPDPTPTLPT